MYQNQQTGVINEPNVTIAQNIKEQFQELNERQTKLLTVIEDKLHDLVNKRATQPETVAKGIERPIGDFNSMLLAEIDKMRNNSNKLEDILNHLQAII